jgi:TolB-like protein
MKKAFLFVLAISTCVGIFAQQPVVAVAPFDAISGISATDANMITRVFTIRLGNTQKVAFVDRTIVDRVLREHRFQAGDWSNAQKTAELGKALNADWIVRGELEKFGSSTLVTVQFYNIQTFRFMGGADIRIANADAAYDNMDPLVNKLIEAIAAAQSATVSRTYNIGDRGPAGGWVFYDKGSYSAGWRYLETAIDTTEVGIYGEDESTYYNAVINGTGDSIGSGKSNTKAISERTNVGPAFYCINLNFGGFNDWFLPSLEELKMIYENLHKKKMGNFRYTFYVSSTLLPLNYAGMSSSICLDFLSGMYTDFERGGWDDNASDPSSIKIVRAVRAF